MRDGVGSEVSCPRCGTRGRGRFCGECGAPLRDAVCPSCSEPAIPGDRFCTTCGTRFPWAGDAGAPEAGALPKREVARGAKREPGKPREPFPWGWLIAGLAAAAVVLFALRGVGDRTGAGIPGGAGAPNTQGQGSPAGIGPAPDISSMTPQEQALRLFERVMTLHQFPDSAARVQFFLPMAIQAHMQAGPLDADMTYHLVLLQQVGGDLDAARATAEQGLDQFPDHLLLLASLAQVLAEAGDREGAEAQYRRYLEVYEEEMPKTRPGYADHLRQLPEFRAQAEQFLGGAGSGA